MDILEVILLIVGIVIFIGSFLLPAGRSDAGRIDTDAAKQEIHGQSGGQEALLFSPQLYPEPAPLKVLQALSRNGSVCARNKNCFLLI